MSPKDSALNVLYKNPASAFEDIVKKLWSSKCAWNCLENKKAEAEAQGRELMIALIWNP